mgnify:CR=1 FL=1
MHIKRNKYARFIVEDKVSGTKIKISRRYLQQVLIDTHRIAVDDAFNYSTDELVKQCLEVYCFCRYIDTIVKDNKINESI